MRELRSWVFLVLGLLLASLTGIALFNVVQDFTTRTAVSAAETVDLVAANVDIQPRTVISADQLTRKAYPRALVPDGAITNDADAVSQTTVTKIPAGAAIVRGHLVQAGGSKSRSVGLKEKEVFIAFPVGDALTTGGFVQVGDRVDILATVTAPDGARRTQTILQNLEVIELVSGSALQSRGTTALTFIVDNQQALVLKWLRDSQAIVDIAVRSRAGAPANTTQVDLDYIISTYRIKK